MKSIKDLKVAYPYKDPNVLLRWQLSKLIREHKQHYKKLGEQTCPHFKTGKRVQRKRTRDCGWCWREYFFSLKALERLEG